MTAISATIPPINNAKNAPIFSNKNESITIKSIIAATSPKINPEGEVVVFSYR